MGGWAPVTWFLPAARWLLSAAVGVGILLSVEWMAARQGRPGAESPEVLLEVVRLAPEPPRAARSSAGRSARENRSIRKSAVSNRANRKRPLPRRAATPSHPMRPERGVAVASNSPVSVQKDAANVPPPMAELDPARVRDIQPTSRLPAPPGDNLSEATVFEATVPEAVLSKAVLSKAMVSKAPVFATLLPRTVEASRLRSLPPLPSAKVSYQASTGFPAGEKRANPRSSTLLEFSIPREPPTPSLVGVSGRVSGGSGDAGSSGFSPRRPETLDAGFGILGELPRPLYPERARRLGRGGSVVLDILVGPEGNVMRVVVVSESLGWGFGAAAREAYAKAVFTPPRANGRPVRVLWRKTLRFRP